MAKKEKIKEEQEKLKQRRQYNIDHNLPSEELENIRKNLWLHNILYKVMSLFNSISGYEKDFERHKFDFGDSIEREYIKILVEESYGNYDYYYYPSNSDTLTDDFAYEFKYSEK